MTAFLILLFFYLVVLINCVNLCCCGLKKKKKRMGCAMQRERHLVSSHGIPETWNRSEDCRITWKANLDRILPLIWWMIWAFRLPLLSMSPTMTGKNWAKRRLHDKTINTVDTMETLRHRSVPLLDPSALLQRRLLQTYRRSLLRCSRVRCGSPLKDTIICHTAL